MSIAPNHRITLRKKIDAAWYGSAKPEAFLSPIPPQYKTMPIQDEPMSIKDEAVTIDYLSSADEADCKTLIGKIVARIEAYEYSFQIFFTDGTYVECRGSMYGSGALGVDITSPAQTRQAQVDSREELLRANADFRKYIDKKV